MGGGPLLGGGEKAVNGAQILGLGHAVPELGGLGAADWGHSSLGRQVTFASAQVIGGENNPTYQCFLRTLRFSSSPKFKKGRSFNTS